MRNINKKQNLVEKARINLDKEKILHSITQARVEKLESIIKEVRKYIEERRKYKGEPFYLDEIQTEIVCEILDKVEENK